MYAFTIVELFLPPLVFVNLFIVVESGSLGLHHLIFVFVFAFPFALTTFVGFAFATLVAFVVTVVFVDVVVIVVLFFFLFFFLLDVDSWTVSSVIADVGVAGVTGSLIGAFTSAFSG